MAKQQKNYCKKPAGSAAVLCYFAILPFYKSAAYLSALQKPARDAEADILWAMEQAVNELQAHFVVEGKLLDDGIVEVYPIIEETHILLYAKFPATVSPHTALTVLKVKTTTYLKKTELAWYPDTYSSLFKNAYLVFSAAGDPEDVSCLSRSVYGDHLVAFFLENDLQGDPRNLHLVRKAKYGKKRTFMSNKVSLYV